MGLECKSQGTPGVTGKFGLGVQNEAGPRLMEFCQENTLVIANTLLQQHKKKRVTEDEMVGWHLQVNGPEQTLGDSEGQGSLVCCKT